MSAIDLTVLANKFQNDLNAILGNTEIQFKIWSEAGQYQAFQREGNTVTWVINGNLRRTTSSNDANDLIMGVNGLTLDFAIPIKQPRTNTKQTEEELAKVQNGQYPFVQYITNAINEYFAKAQVFTVASDDGTYSVAFRAGMSTTGTVDLIPVLGNCITVNVFIELIYVQSGINSKSVKITVDGQNVPYQALRWGRSPMVERSVYAGDSDSKNVISSTAFAIDIDLPVNAGSAANDPVSAYLLDGTPNVAHFVNLNINGTDYNYFMTLNTAQASAQGISITGTSISFMEIPNGYFEPGINKMGMFVVPSSTVKKITAQVQVSNNPYDGEFLAYVGGKCGKYPLNFSIEVTPDMLIYNKAQNVYYLTIVFPNPTNGTVSNPQADGQAVSYLVVN